MLKVLLCCLPFFCFAADKPIVTHFEHKNHRYLCFNGTQVVHDPDCLCNSAFEGYFIDSEGKHKTIILFPKSNPYFYRD